jgi:hypothetical protein
VWRVRIHEETGDSFKQFGGVCLHAFMATDLITFPEDGDGVSLKRRRFLNDWDGYQPEKSSYNLVGTSENKCSLERREFSWKDHTKWAFRKWILNKWTGLNSRMERSILGLCERHDKRLPSMKAFDVWSCFFTHLMPAVLLIIFKNTISTLQETTCYHYKDY